MKSTLGKGLAAVCATSLSLVIPAVQAASIAIAATPTESSGPFQHNVFHTASSNAGESGTVLAWFDLGVGGGSWDPDTGAFLINIDLYADSSLTSLIGSAVGSGTLLAAEFNGYDGGLIGTIAWNFDAAAESNGLTDVTTAFLDVDYATSTQGYTANSVTGAYDSMALWGADGGYDPLTGAFNTATTSMGVDMVVTFVPLPPAIWLFSSGLAVLLLRRRSNGS